MKQRIIVVLITILAALLASVLPALAAVDTAAALDYLKTQQNADGGFGSGFSPDSTVASTADAVQAILAAGGDLATFDQGGKTPLTYLSTNAKSTATAGDLAKLIMATIAAGENPRQFGGVDSVAGLESMIGADGRIGGEKDTFVSHILAVLALASTQRPVPDAAVSQLKDAQQENGGWAWDGSSATAADTNTTAFVVQALVAAGESASGEAITNALAYYKNIQNEDGGWPYQNPSDFGTTTDANSTAVVIQALIATGQDPTGAEWTTAPGNTPVAALEGFQNASGAFAWQAAMPDDNLLATIQALPALAGKAFPLATMDVGAATVAAATVPAPTTVPQTGGAALNLAWPLIASGLALAGGGYALRRRK
jgi:prenyltransferase beta subunit